MTAPAYNRFARGRTPRQGRSFNTEEMNKLESEYAACLNLQKAAGEILDWKYESVKLKLASKTFYTPDFQVITADGFVEYHETKGFWEDDARVKIKMAAAAFPWFKFIAIQKKKGIWTTEEF